LTALISFAGVIGFFFSNAENEKVGQFLQNFSSLRNEQSLNGSPEQIKFKKCRYNNKLN